MPEVKGGATARIAFLLSKFKLIPIPNEKSMEVRFDYTLPRAPTLVKAVIAAMVAEGVAVPADKPYVEVSAEEHHFINYLYKLFTPVNPNIDPDAERTFKFEQTYEWAISKNFTTSGDVTPEEVLRNRANYQAPTPLVELRTDKDEYWYLIMLALRKSCDSAQTSIVWNAAQHLRPYTIKWFVNLVHGAVTAQQYATVEELVEAVKTTCLKDHEYMGDSECALIYCAWRLFDDKDWEGMISNLIVWQWEIDAREKQKAAEQKVK